MNTMLKDLAEVVGLLDDCTDEVAESHYKSVRFIRTHYATLAQNAEAAKDLNELLATVHRDGGLGTEHAVAMAIKKISALNVLPDESTDDSRKLKALEQAIYEYVAEHPYGWAYSAFAWVKKRADEIMRGD